MPRSGTSQRDLFYMLLYVISVSRPLPSGFVALIPRRPDTCPTLAALNVYVAPSAYYSVREGAYRDFHAV